ncbi:MAG: galactose ABC transporter substrate-binding protein [Oscillospiraceae bacterium]
MKHKNIFRRAAAALLLACTLMSLAGCGDGGRADSVKIGVCVYKGDDTFIASMMDCFQKVASDYETEAGVTVNLTFADAAESQITQNQQIERFLSLDYDVLCVNLVDRTDAANVIDKAREAGVPVVFFNREPVMEDMKRWDKLLYVGSDARESAELEAQIIIDRFNAAPESIDKNGDGVIKYIMLEGERRHQDAIIRTEVSVEALREAGLNVEKLDGGIANWNRDQASALAETYFKEYGSEIELIICNNDDMALGAADAAARLGLSFSDIVGIDGTEKGRAAVGEGALMGTVVMDLEAHAEAIFAAARAFVAGTDPADILEVREDKSVRVPMYIEVS